MSNVVDSVQVVVEAPNQIVINETDINIFVDEPAGNNVVISFPGIQGPAGRQTVSDTPPADNPAAGDQWFNSSNGRQFVFFDSYWVEVGAAFAGPVGQQGITGPVGPTGPQGPAGTWVTAQTMNTQSVSYTAQASDVGKLVTITNALAVEFIVNTGLGLVAGQRIDILQLGVGQITVVPHSTTINTAIGLKLRTRYSHATLLCVGTETFVLTGDISV